MLVGLVQLMMLNIKSVCVYDVNTDHWDQLPPSVHYCGVPHIIGGKLAIIGGGCLSATNKATNKVSTLDETRPQGIMLQIFIIIMQQYFVVAYTI